MDSISLRKKLLAFHILLVFFNFAFCLLASGGPLGSFLSFFPLRPNIHLREESSKASILPHMHFGTLMFILMCSLYLFRCSCFTCQKLSTPVPSYCLSLVLFSVYPQNVVLPLQKYSFVILVVHFSFPSAGKRRPKWRKGRWCAACDDSSPCSHPPSTALPCLTPPSSTPHTGATRRGSIRERDKTQKDDRETHEKQETQSPHAQTPLHTTPLFFLVSLSVMPSIDSPCLTSPYPPHHRWPIGGTTGGQSVGRCQRGRLTTENRQTNT